MNRDIIIEDKIKDLKELKVKLEEKVKNQGKPITNLKVGSINLRTINTVNELNEAFSIVYNSNLANNAFNTIIEDDATIQEKTDFKIYGYSYDEWVNDFKMLYINITVSNKLNIINNAIKQLEDYYSEDKQTENKFNALLTDIDGILG